MSKREQVSKFMKWYEGSLADTDNCEAAYQLTETTWIREYGNRYYKNYESFKSSRVFWKRHTKPDKKRLSNTVKV